jgi:hypothetical protein
MPQRLARLRRLAADEVVELALRELAVTGDDREVVLDLADDLRCLPQPLACVGVRASVRRQAATYSASSLAKTSCSSSLRSSSWARAPRPIAVWSLSSVI